MALASAAPVPVRSLAMQTGAGLAALAELMQAPEVRQAVIVFRTDFQAAVEQINRLFTYKEIHDRLHTLQFRVYNPLVAEARRFPEDEVARASLVDYELTLSELVRDLQDIANRENLPRNERWIDDLPTAREQLRQAIDHEDVGLLKQAIRLLDRTLALQPVRINAYIVNAARAIRLPALVQVLTTLHDHLAHHNVDSERLQAVNANIEALGSLTRRLEDLVVEQDRWQMIDHDLRRIEATLEQDTTELEWSWPDLKTQADLLYGDSADPWATSLKAAGDALEEAIDARDQIRTKYCFRRYHVQAAQRFYRVDRDLLELCQSLRVSIEPLDAVLRMIE
jgi:hypothetical protein